MSGAALVRNCWAVALLSIPPAASAEEPSETARRVLAGLSLEAKVGQVLMPRAPAEFRNLADPERRELLEMAESGRLGGVVVFAGSPGGTRGITTALQDAAPLPVLVAADYEWGTPMRTAGGVRFPPAMQAAAAPDPAALERQGRIVAREARAVLDRRRPVERDHPIRLLAQPIQPSRLRPNRLRWRQWDTGSSSFSKMWSYQPKTVWIHPIF